MVEKLRQTMRNKIGWVTYILVASVFIATGFLFYQLHANAAISASAQNRLGIALTSQTDAAEIADALDANTTLVSATAGTATASKAVILDASKGIATITSATITTLTSPTVKASSLDTAAAGTLTIGGATQTNVALGRSGQNVTVSGNVVTTVGNGAKNGATVAAVEKGDGVIHQTVLTCTATTITITDDAAVAQYGGVKVYDMPEGSVVFLGCVIDGSLTAGVTGTIIDAWNGDVALGTATATTGATLTGTEADILQSTATTLAVTKVANCDAQSIATALTEAGSRWFDGTTAAKDVYLNYVIDDDVSHTTGTATFTGTITITWMNLGDY